MKSKPSPTAGSRNNPNAPQKPTQKVSELLKSRLRDTKRTSADLAAAIEVPESYVDELVSGKRRPPRPARTDIYERMTRFLGLGRNDLVESAKWERDSKAPSTKGPVDEVRDLVLSLCQPDTAKALEKRAKKDHTELTGLIQRVLDVVQGAVCRVLEDQIALRIAATQNGMNYTDMRLRVLEFLDATAETLTVNDFAYFVRPQIAQWDIDPEHGALRVLLRSREPQERHRRRPMVRRGGTRLAG
jgi:hypothetical protein